MSNSPHRKEKDRQKIVRRSQNLPFAEDEPTYNLENLEKGYHKSDLDKKKLKKEEHLSAQIQAFEHDMQRKKAKRRKKNSKRTTPGYEVDYETSYNGWGKEGERWDKTLKLQARDKSRKLQHKLDHQKKAG